MLEMDVIVVDVVVVAGVVMMGIVGVISAMGAGNCGRGNVAGGATGTGFNRGRSSGSCSESEEDSGCGSGDNESSFQFPEIEWSSEDCSEETETSDEVEDRRLLYNDGLGKPVDI